MDFLQSTENILIFSLVVLMVSLFILYEIIKAATRGKKIYIEAQKQTKLLTEMAKKNGVDDDVIKSILDDSQYLNSSVEEKKS